MLQDKKLYLLQRLNTQFAPLSSVSLGGKSLLFPGIMNRDFVANGTAAAMVNSAVEGFAQAAALGTPRGIRINVVSPALLAETVEKYSELCPGFEPVSSEKVARVYRKSVYGIQTGQVFQIQ